MAIQNLLGIKYSGATLKTLYKHQDNNFAKNTFNFSNIDLSRPVNKVTNSALGDPDKAAFIDLLA